jgi:DNA (cytosine-5)-methyltransferase 1
MVATLQPAGDLAEPSPREPFHPRGVRRAYAALPEPLKSRWLWWRLPAPARRNTALEQVLEPEAAWSAVTQTQRLVGQMNPSHRARAERPPRAVGAAYRRIRVEQGCGSSGWRPAGTGWRGACAPPAGGSSRQFVLLAGPDGLKSRLLTPREGARLMGLPDSYRLPRSSTAAWRVVGDGVAAPVVRWLAAHLLEPLCRSELAQAA